MTNEEILARKNELKTMDNSSLVDAMGKDKYFKMDAYKELGKRNPTIEWLLTAIVCSEDSTTRNRLRLLVDTRQDKETIGLYILAARVANKDELSGVETNLMSVWKNSYYWTISEMLAEEKDEKVVTMFTTVLKRISGQDFGNNFEAYKDWHRSRYQGLK